MIAKHKLLLFALLAVSLVTATAIEASAFCSTCGVPVAAYRPVYTTAYAPVAYTAYRPYTGWYPGYWADRVRTRLWGAPVAYTAAYYPASYSVGYASYATSYAPACSSCGVSADESAEPHADRPSRAISPIHRPRHPVGHSPLPRSGDGGVTGPGW